MPWTPPPGGVEAEQRYTPASGVPYGFHRGTGRNTVWRSVAAPPLTSPPSRFGLCDSASRAVRTVRASTRPRKPPPDAQHEAAIEAAEAGGLTSSLPASDGDRVAAVTITGSTVSDNTGTAGDGGGASGGATSAGGGNTIGGALKMRVTMGVPH